MLKDKSSFGLSISKYRNGQFDWPKLEKHSNPVWRPKWREEEHRKKDRLAVFFHPL